MILFTERISPRLAYIAEFISTECLEEGLVITTHRQEYLDSTEPRINYSGQPIADREIQIIPHGLLFAQGIGAVRVEVKQWKDIPVFFHTNGTLPFDLFSAIFYLLSRYEEYLPYVKDEYGRFAHTQSIAFRHGFLHRPLINEWLLSFQKKIVELFPGVDFRSKNFEFLPTYDIDIAFSYRGKGWWRNSAALVRSLGKGQWPAFRERLAVLQGRQPDPYDCYEWLDRLHAKSGYKARYFFHVGLRQGVYDRNILPSQPVLRDLIGHTGSKYTIGLHPSWRSGDEENLLTVEKETLERISGKPISLSRFHYIRFLLPHGYRRLIAAGIKEDHSMGYGSINGFRASVASPFYWYDLEKEERTGLLLYPFCFMEANSYYEQKQGSEESLDEMMGYLKRTRDVNGLMVTIWHNNFLGSDPAFQSWREVYARFLGAI